MLKQPLHQVPNYAADTEAPPPAKTRSLFSKEVSQTRLSKSRCLGCTLISHAQGMRVETMSLPESQRSNPKYTEDEEHIVKQVCLLISA